MKNVAVIGRPNVGKSSFINRIIGERAAIVQDKPGVTRDNVSYPASWNGTDFKLIDTGGIQTDSDVLNRYIRAQAIKSIDYSDVIVYIVDGQTMIFEDDAIIVDKIRKSGKPFILVVNKIDNDTQMENVYQYWNLGLGEPYPISSLHGRNIGDLLDTVVKMIGEAKETHEENILEKIAIVGRPNVGKSSLLNSFLQTNRSLVNFEAGTTRDAIDENVIIDGTEYTLIDTAGIKRRPTMLKDIDYYSYIRTKISIERCDLALVVLDAKEMVLDQDLKIINEVIENGKSLVIILNKYDLLDDYEKKVLDDEIDKNLNYLPWVRYVRVSALNSYHINKIGKYIEEGLESRHFRVATSKLNEFVTLLTQKQPPRVKSGKLSRILYTSQVATNPPKILVHTSLPLEQTYIRFLLNSIRKEYGFFGTPINIEIRPKPSRA